MVWRARAARRLLGVKAEISVSPVESPLDPLARLDEGLFTRPLPDRLVVVGRHRSCTSAVIARLAGALDGPSASCAVTAVAPPVAGDAGLLEMGAGFRGGPLCQAGGFTGDGRRDVHDRLVAIGFESIAVLAPSVQQVPVRRAVRAGVPA